jgi:hypothetical protein
MEVTMAKARSPGYPTIGLREAIEKVKLVYEKDYQNRIPRRVVAEHMGYQSLNGKSLGVLSAVSKFGLLEGRGEENCVSDLALQIIAHAPGTPERSQAIADAASRPDLFADLDTRFPGGRASDAGIRSYLMTRKFIPVAADMAIRAYRETKGLVNEETGNYTGESVPEADQNETRSMPPAAEIAHSRPHIPAASMPILGGEREYLRGPLTRDSGYRLMVSGEIGPRELGKIIKLLTLQQELLLETDAESGERPEQ